MKKSGMISLRQETERETALVDALRPRISIFMETVMMIKLTRFQKSESNCSELDAEEQEALISLRDTRKKLQHATKSRRFYPKGGGRARSTRKSIDELKKVTSCNRCGAIGHWEEDCSQPARSRKKKSPPQRAKEKVVGSGERNLMAKDEEFQTIPMWRSTTMVRRLTRHI